MHMWPSSPTKQLYVAICDETWQAQKWYIPFRCCYVHVWLAETKYNLAILSIDVQSPNANVYVYSHTIKEAVLMWWLTWS